MAYKEDCTLNYLRPTIQGMEAERQAILYDHSRHLIVEVVWGMALLEVVLREKDFYIPFECSERINVDHKMHDIDGGR